jgi:HNH endonuclease
MTVVFVSAPPDPIRTVLKGRLRGPFSFCEIAMRRRPRVTRARLRALLHYDAETGEFHWLKRMNARVRAGGVAGTLADNGYRLVTIKGRQYRAHQLAWLYMTGKWCSLVIDHRDGDPSNNRWNNLRSATLSQSNANRGLHRNNACRLKGVTRNGGGWRATIHKNGRRHHLGIFRTPQAAHAAYEAAARKLFGEFARTE